MGSLSRLYSDDSAQVFNFENVATKINYAKAKFMVAVVMMALYWPLSLLAGAIGLANSN